MLLDRFANDPGFKKRQASSKTNRASSKGGCLHTGGFATLPKTRRRMTRSLDRPPTDVEVFRETYTRKRDRTIVEKRAEDLLTEFSANLEEATQKAQEEGDDESPATVDPDTVWRQTLSEPYKNRVYGAGGFFASSLRRSDYAVEVDKNNVRMERVALSKENAVVRESNGGELEEMRMIGLSKFGEPPPERIERVILSQNEPNGSEESYPFPPGFGPDNGYDLVQGEAEADSGCSRETNQITEEENGEQIPTMPTFDSSKMKLVKTTIVEVREDKDGSEEAMKVIDVCKTGSFIFREAEITPIVQKLTGEGSTSELKTYCLRSRKKNSSWGSRCDGDRKRGNMVASDEYIYF
ncbi:hypothetical protein PIB30_071941 [Stylosanthes scabra]|uniref:Uncharacterized protein n=1 Tax=Stylosanthes scabra TaxID=79078 RepID=A0ABU6RPJ4_9FABA|nr:hypothetical protein [Stylosanthes scabra]